MSKPILCLDFDGVIHSFESGWKGADVIPDPPVPGTRDFLIEATKHFEVHIFSSRSNQEGGIVAMKQYMGRVISPDPNQEISEQEIEVLHSLQWPTEKPPAFLTIDDRAIQFEGIWPDMAELANFKPWNRR